MKKISAKNLLIVIIICIIAIVTFARHSVSSSLEKTVREYFGLSDLITSYSVSQSWAINNAPVVVAHINMPEWRLARSRLMEHYGTSIAVDSIDSSTRKAITELVGEKNLKDSLVFVESDPMGGVVYCIIGCSKNNGPILFFVVQRI